jgi:CRP-like cAMP-binding protein
MLQTDRHPQTAADNARSLRDIRIFADLAPKELALLAAECAWHHFNNGDVVQSAGRGDTHGEVMFVVCGSVRLARPMGPSGRIVYKDVEAGGQFGEMSLFGVNEDDLTVISREDSVLAVMHEATFMDLLGREESVSRALLCQYATLLRLRENATAAEEIPGATGAQRVYGELLSLAEPRAAAGDKGPGLFVARLPRHRELADRLSTTEEVVAAAIAELVRRGIAQRDYPGLFIADEIALRGLCLHA